MTSELCPDCNLNSIIFDDHKGILVCEECGYCLKERVISYEPEDRTFEGEENKIRRVGIPENPDSINNSGSTLMVRENGKTKMYKTYSNQDKIIKNKKKIQKMLSNAEVPQIIINKAKSLYNDLVNNKQNMQGRNFNDIIIAIYYQACKSEKQYKGIKEITKMFNITERKLKRTYSCIQCNFEHNDEENELINKEKKYIDNYLGVNMAKADEKLIACQIVENINNNSILEGKAPTTIAGLSLLLSYILFSDNTDNDKEFYSFFSQRAVLSKYFEEIKNSLPLIIPKEYDDKIEAIKKIHI